MTSRQLLLVIAVVALTLTAGCLGVPTASESPNSAAGSPEMVSTSATTGSSEAATISVSATGEVTTDPDLAVVSLAVERTEETADAAREAVASDVGTMRTALREAGVAQDQVRTVSFSIFPEYDYSVRRPELVGYRAVHAFEVEVAPGEAGNVIDVAVAGGATRVTGVTFTVTDETARELRTEALGLAMGDAKADAETLAEAAGVSVASVHTISTADVGVSPVRQALEAGDAEARAPTVLEPGPVSVTAHVQVTYRIGPQDGQSA